jgi:hypothetical protein
MASSVQASAALFTSPEGLAERGHMLKNLSVIETVLRNRYHFFGEIREGVDVSGKLKALLISSVVFLGLYGGVMGSSHSALQALSAAIKLPLLFLATLLVCAPTLYFLNVLYGSSQTLVQSVLLLLTTVAVSAVILLSFAPIILFFLVSSSHYQFFKLLNVGVFTLAGVLGVSFLSQGMRILSTGASEGARARRRLVRIWILTYAFTGSQMAWTLRPFIGAPSMGFELFRQLGGSFYGNVLASFGEILGFFPVR